MNDEYKVKPINRDQCSYFILQIHYAKKWSSISYAYGLFKNDELVGCVTYGTPPSHPLKIGIAGKKFYSYILELNRLCLKYNRKNEASFLVSQSLKFLKNKINAIIISFADISQNHIGKVYQACNFYYCGLSAKRTDWKIKGQENLHGQTIADKYRNYSNRAKAIYEDYGNDFYLSERPRKHRYVYIIGSKKFRKNAFKSLKYAIKPYPK